MASKVLIVEDSNSFALLLQKMIEEHGFDVTIVATFEETKQELQQHANEYFVATVDYNLPDAPDGEAIQTVLDAEIPTIVFTSSTDSILKKSLWEKGISDYACKQGTYNLEYVSWMVKRIYSNQKVEVLVVDDSLMERKRLQRLLKTQGFIVYTANSGINGLKMLEKHPKISLTITDCYMDDISGYEFTKSIREKYPRGKMEIIGISALEDPLLSTQFIKSGADDFIHKPYQPEELLCRVNHAVDRLEQYQSLKKLNSLKNQFIGMAAHDIRGPLGSIKTASDFLIKRSLSKEREESLLKMISKSSEDLLLLLETLLDVSIIESGVIQLSMIDIDYSQLVEERVELYRPGAVAKNIEIIKHIDGGLSIRADEIKLKQVIDNLLTNAIKYSEQSGEIKVSLTLEEDSLILTVQDNGPGIPEDEQKLLFKAYKVLSTEATAGEKKTGLGLAIAKNIIDAHRGNIYYKHNDETHSTFYVVMSMVDD